jgi:hypothetical protein
MAATLSASIAASARTNLGRGGPSGAGARAIWLRLSANLCRSVRAHRHGRERRDYRDGRTRRCRPALPAERRPRGSLDDRVGEQSLSHEIPPGRRIGPNSLSRGPAFGDGPVRVVSAPCPVDWREARRQSSEFAQALADMAEAQAWLQPLNQCERPPPKGGGFGLRLKAGLGRPQGPTRELARRL